MFLAFSACIHIMANWKQLSGIKADKIPLIIPVSTLHNTHVTVTFFNWNNLTNKLCNIIYHPKNLAPYKISDAPPSIKLSCRNNMSPNILFLWVIAVTKYNHDDWWEFLWLILKLRNTCRLYTHKQIFQDRRKMNTDVHRCKSQYKLEYSTV